MTIQYLMHVGICVSDLPRALRFYREGLGFVEAGGLEVSDAATAQLMEIPGVGSLMHRVPGRRTRTIFSSGEALRTIDDGDPGRPSAPGTLKRLIVTEDATVPVLGLFVRCLRWAAANMMMYTCVSRARRSG